MYVLWYWTVMGATVQKHPYQLVLVVYYEMNFLYIIDKQL